MTLILALDVATVTGFACGRIGEIPVAGSIRFGKHGVRDHVVFGEAINWMHATLHEPPDLLIIESMLPPDAMRNATSRAVRDRLAGLHGIVKGIAHLRGVGEIAEASVGDIRAHFIGDRRLRRPDAKRYVMQRCKDLGWPCPDDNAGDALALWSYACALIDPRWALQVSPLFNRQLRIKADDYNATDDFAKSIDEAYRVIRQRKAAGGKGWEPP
jgi:hypothetical protein